MTARFLAALAALLVLGTASVAQAQTSGLVFDRNRPDQKIPQAPRDQRPPPAPSAAPQAAFTPFVLRGVRVEGASANADIIGAASRPFIGKTLDAKALDELVGAVAEAYGRTDVALYTVTAPQQDFADGVLRLSAIEGYIGQVVMHVDGPAGAIDRIKAYADKLTSERPLHRSTLERYLSLIRDIPGLSVEADLQRTDTPGAVKLALEARQKRIEPTLAVNNRGTALLGRTQFTAQVRAYDLLRGGDSTQLTFAFPANLRLFQYYGLAHTQLLNAEGTTLGLNAGYLRTRPRGTTLAGEAKLAGVQIVHPFVRRYDRTLTLTAGLDGLDSTNALLGQTFADERTRVLRLAPAYARTGDKTSYSLSASANLGLNGLGARIVDSRGARSDFRKITARAALDHAIGTGLTLRLRAAGQYSPDRVPASELFALGGDEFGRAFEAATLTGDSGYGASAEIGWLAKPAPMLLSGTELYGFVDGGKAWTRVLGASAQGSSLASAGLGIRAAIAAKGVVQVEAAHAIDRPSPFSGGDRWRVVVSFRSLF